MKKILTNLATTKPLQDVPIQEVLDELSKSLECTHSQLSTIMDDVIAHFKRTVTEILLPHLAAPLFFMVEVKFVAWERIPLEVQSAVKKLSDEVARGRIPHGFIADYVISTVLRTSEKPSHTPSIYSLDHGAMIQLCRDMQV